MRRLSRGGSDAACTIGLRAQVLTQPGRVDDQDRARADDRDRLGVMAGGVAVEWVRPIRTMMNDATSSSVAVSFGSLGLKRITPSLARRAPAMITSPSTSSALTRIEPRIAVSASTWCPALEREDNHEELREVRERRLQDAGDRRPRPAPHLLDRDRHDPRHAGKCQRREHEREDPRDAADVARHAGEDDQHRDDDEQRAFDSSQPAQLIIGGASRSRQLTHPLELPGLDLALDTLIDLVLAGRRFGGSQLRVRRLLNFRISSM